LIENKFHFCGGWGMSLEPCISYVLFLPTELSSRELIANKLVEVFDKTNV